MRAEVAIRARRHIEVPWDELRAARVRRRALEAVRQRESGGSETSVLLRQGGRPLATVMRWVLVAATVLLVIGVSAFGLRALWTDDVEPATGSTVARSAVSSLEFADDSRCFLSAQARVRVLRDSAERIHVQQSAGTVRYEVQPKPSRQFEVMVMGVAVVVVGTVFDVTVADGKVSVAVVRGRVRVIHRRRTVALAAGERVTVSTTVSEDRHDSSASGDELPVDEPRAMPTNAAGGNGSNTGLTAAEWMQRADQARAAGRPSEAARALRSLLEQYPRDGRALLALFTLGQLERQLGHHAAAASAFERCGVALQGDAIAEAAVSWAAAGQSGRARAAAERYLRQFPSGLHAKRLQALVGSKK